jgi:hypothetical protein
MTLCEVPNLAHASSEGFWMDEFLETIDQPITADRVRELVGRYDLSLVRRGDPPDEGFPRKYYLESKKHGVHIQYCEAGLVKTVSLSSGQRGFSPFRGPLIAGISFQSYREDVIRALGSPSRSASPGVVPGLGRPTGGWDCYDRETYSISFSYSATTRMLVLVIISAPEIFGRQGYSV